MAKLKAANQNLYLIKGNTPLCLYHWPRWGLYLYASTEDILKKSLQGIRIKLGVPEEVGIDSGDIVRIDRYGHIVRNHFDVSHSFSNHSYGWPYHFSFLNWESKPFPDEYVSELKAVARAFGCSPDDIDLLLREDFTPEEIEECFYNGKV